MKNAVFSFLKKERLGAFFLCVILVLGTLALLYRKTAYSHERMWKVITLAKEENAWEVNTMKQEDWEKLKLFSEANLQLLLEYRSLLGGFYRLSQIREVISMPDSSFLRLQQQLSCRPEYIRKIALREENWRLLAKHPYIGNDLAKILLILQHRIKNRVLLNEKLSTLCSVNKLSILNMYITF